MSEYIFENLSWLDYNIEAKKNDEICDYYNKVIMSKIKEYEKSFIIPLKLKECKSLQEKIKDFHIYIHDIYKIFFKRYLKAKSGESKEKLKAYSDACAILIQRIELVFLTPLNNQINNLIYQQNIRLGRGSIIVGIIAIIIGFILTAWSNYSSNKKSSPVINNFNNKVDKHYNYYKIICKKQESEPPVPKVKKESKKQESEQPALPVVQVKEELTSKGPNSNSIKIGPIPKKKLDLQIKKIKKK